MCIRDSGVASESTKIALAGQLYMVAAIVGAMLAEPWMMVQGISLAHIGYFGTMAWEWRPKSKLS